MKFTKQSGQVLFGTAAALVVLAGFAGLAIDMGTLRYQRRLQQTAADGAAVAGASNLAASSGEVVAAQTAATNNGFTDGSGNTLSACNDSAAVGLVCVQVTKGPTTGPHAGDIKYIEAYVSVVQPTYFMQIFGVNSRVVTARAVATATSGSTASSGCLYTLGPPTAAIEGIAINGSVVINATTCGIVDNGNYNTKGNALILNAGSFGVSGTRSSTGSGGSVTCTQPQTVCPETNVPMSGDPLATMTPPAVQTPNFGDVTTSGTQTLQPGTYNSITIGKNSIVTLNPGIYYINGTGSPSGVTFKGGGQVTGNGVMFYFTNGSTINAVGGGNNLDIQLHPMTIAQSVAAAGTDMYAGILFYQDPLDTVAPSLGGDNNSIFGGVLYFPSVTLTFFGNNVSYATGIVISDALSFSGNPTVNLQGAAGLPAGVSIVKNAILVE